ncbi:hypothetical protein PPERSA_10812 [Pseudocohnilembus persalinus]|uniref:Uncharacterized protein n=1 Tax=Pseudocohnilembus persalinus TaxID=266149 RepID=A0A0V0QDP5_PSEPJ|nr:hypothetical protein PPERSA_10812 [Pseudocohnilembus persalinus]|eukprot:KRX00313.1 hypothetical protein PPERSA_10812 [Pseudocohnilembus persalinus]
MSQQQEFNIYNLNKSHLEIQQKTQQIEQQFLKQQQIQGQDNYYNNNNYNNNNSSFNRINQPQFQLSSSLGLNQPQQYIQNNYNQQFDYNTYNQNLQLQEIQQKLFQQTDDNLLQLSNQFKNTHRELIQQEQKNIMNLSKSLQNMNLNESNKKMNYSFNHKYNNKNNLSQQNDEYYDSYIENKSSYQEQKYSQNNQNLSSLQNEASIPSQQFYPSTIQEVSNEVDSSQTGDQDDEIDMMTGKKKKSNKQNKLSSAQNSVKSEQTNKYKSKNNVQMFFDNIPVINVDDSQLKQEIKKEKINYNKHYLTNSQLSDIADKVNKPLQFPNVELLKQENYGSFFQQDLLNDSLNLNVQLNNTSQLQQYKDQYNNQNNSSKQMELVDNFKNIPEQIQKYSFFNQQFLDSHKINKEIDNSYQQKLKKSQKYQQFESMRSSKINYEYNNILNNNDNQKIYLPSNEAYVNGNYSAERDSKQNYLIFQQKQNQFFQQLEEKQRLNQQQQQQQFMQNQQKYANLDCVQNNFLNNQNQFNQGSNLPIDFSNNINNTYVNQTYNLLDSNRQQQNHQQQQYTKIIQNQYQMQPQNQSYFNQEQNNYQSNMQLQNLQNKNQLKNNQFNQNQNQNLQQYNQNDDDQQHYPQLVIKTSQSQEFQNDEINKQQFDSNNQNQIYNDDQNNDSFQNQNQNQYRYQKVNYQQSQQQQQQIKFPYKIEDDQRQNMDLNEHDSMVNNIISDASQQDLTYQINDSFYTQQVSVQDNSIQSFRQQYRQTNRQKIKSSKKQKNQGEKIIDYTINTAHVPTNIMNALMQYLLQQYKKIQCQNNNSYIIFQQDASKMCQCSVCQDYHKLKIIKMSKKNKSINTFRLIWKNSKMIRILSEDFFINYCSYVFLSKKKYKNSGTDEHTKSSYKCLPRFLWGVRNHQNFIKIKGAFDFI